MLLHHGLFRTMEGRNSSCGDYNCQLPPLKAHLSLPDTKTSKRHGRSESVGLYDAKVVKLLTLLCENRQPETKFTLAAQQRSASNLDGLCQLCTSKSSQCARGGSTDFFKKTNSMQEVAFRGRWANFATAKLMRLGNGSLQKAARRRLHKLLA